MDQTESLNRLMREALGSGPDADAAKARARELLGLDDLNWSYFFYLYRGKMGGTKSRSLVIHENGKNPAGRLAAYPVAIAPPEMRKHLRQVEYTDLKASRENYGEVATHAALWVKKMQAGSGSSMTRTTYLSRRLGIPESQVRIGAKGTDLFIDTPEGSIPLAEAQILQSIRDFERGEIGEVIFHDIVSSETEESLRKLWEKQSLSDRSKSYAQLIKSTPGLSQFGVTYQSFVPTLDTDGNLSFNRKAPAGHALFAVDALRAAYREELRPKVSKPLIAAISNGEDLSGSPDRYMIGYTIKHRAPIVLVTTERTAVDLKGGLLSLVQEYDGSVSLTVLETAQAKEAGQEGLFSSLPGAMNTNLALFNYEVLVPLLTKEVREIGEDQFMRIISPDLILNAKEQRGSDGVTRKYLQLEGAMGSTIMNLDRHWRMKYGEPLVHVINVDRMHRTEFFSPIKSAFDFFMQFHSDRFSFDSSTMRPRNLRPGELPEVTLKDSASGDKFHQDVQNVLDAFQGAKIRDLDDLVVEGQVDMRGVTLRGKVRIFNRAGRRIELREKKLENLTLEIGPGGEATVTQARA